MKGDSNVRFPRGIEQLSTPSILIESFCYGENILEFKATPFEKRKLAEMGLEMVMKMIFLHDFIHGDLHPGNILVERFDSEKESEKNSRYVIHCTTYQTIHIFLLSLKLVECHYRQQDWLNNERHRLRFGCELFFCCSF